MADHNLYDKQLDNWIENEKIAANLLNLVGQLMYDKGIEVVIFRQNILDVGVTELMRLVSYAENVVKRKIELNIALEIAKEITKMQLPPSKLDLGLLTAEFLEESPKNYTEFLEEKLKWNALGYNYWNQIVCRAPDPNTKYIAIETPIGNKYVCFKQTNQKPQQ